MTAKHNHPLDWTCNYAQDAPCMRAPLTPDPPPRPDYRWVAGVGREQHEPERVPHKLPAPPKVAVMVPADIARAVAEYAEALNRWYDVVGRVIEED